MGTKERHIQRVGYRALCVLPSQVEEAREWRSWTLRPNLHLQTYQAEMFTKIYSGGRGKFM